MSPYNYFQERYRDDPWALLCCVVMLNLTSGVQLEGVHEEFFRRWPDPVSLSLADQAEVERVVRPLGLSNRRSRQLIRMSTVYAFVWDGVDPLDLPGIGRYGRDSWDIFIRGDATVSPADKELRRYLEWLRSR